MIEHHLDNYTLFLLYLDINNLRKGKLAQQEFTLNSPTHKDSDKGFIKRSKTLDSKDTENQEILKKIDAL